jgi:sugar O-acyltransferase (sialic acid O-acetyltransferase NeuD family)
MNRLIIIGAGGHGKVIADAALKNGYANICYIDDHATGDVMGFPIIGTSADIERLNAGGTDFIIGIGNNAVRKAIAEKYNVNWVSIVHPSAQIAFNAEIGKGTVVMANAVVNACATVGEHCIINTGAIVEHDNVIENYAHISPNVALGGTVRIGELTHIGIGATVINNVDVCSGCTIGAGAVVVKDLKTKGTYIGVPVLKM